jgi:hypothetical protein
MTSIKRHYVAVVKEIDLDLLENLFRLAVRGWVPTFKFRYATNEYTTKSMDDLPSYDFSKLSNILDIERKKQGALLSITVFNTNTDFRLAAVDFYDYVFMLYIDAKTKREIENKYGLKFITEKKYSEYLGQ